MERRPRKHQKMTVTVVYPTTEEGMQELHESQAKAMLYVLESRLGEEGLRTFIEYAKEKIGYKN